MSIQLMSFNTQHCLNYRTRKIDFPLFAKTIAHCGGDIVGLNEMRDAGSAPDHEAQARILAEKLGYHWYFAKAIDAGGTAPYGNALLSRYPILTARTIPVPDPVSPKYTEDYETRCLLKAVLDAPGGPLTVCVIHWGLNPDEQENALATVLDHIKEERCVLMGDFNITPDNPLLEPIRARMTDTSALFAEETGSFPSDAPDRRIDYLFVSHDLTTLSADIPALIVSDHRPYLVEIE